MHDLFHRFANRYDLHTPPGHYRNDHAFVLETLGAEQQFPLKLLDLGCGTGVFVEAALAHGFDAFGADAAEEMIAAARSRVGSNRFRVERMQDLQEDGAYDAICSLSWSVHYAEDEADLAKVIARCWTALKPGGRLVFQVANAARMTGAVRVDVESGPADEPDDTFFIHRFEPAGDTVRAHYVYASQAHAELMSETHTLRCCNPGLVMRLLNRAKFAEVVWVDENSVSPFLVARRAD